RALLLTLALPMLLLGWQSPPQILEISPAKGALDVPTNAPIKIRFDRALDRASVASRFSLNPSVDGHVSWEAQNTIVFRHDTLEPSAQYQVRLTAGYRDSQGDVNVFTHSWMFQTEGPPAVRNSSPSEGEAGVDPATYLTFSFSREMNADSFRGSVTLSPSLPFSVQAERVTRSEEHTSELQSLAYLVCRLLLEKKKNKNNIPPKVKNPLSYSLISGHLDALPICQAGSHSTTPPYHVVAVSTHPRFMRCPRR